MLRAMYACYAPLIATKCTQLNKLRDDLTIYMQYTFMYVFLFCIQNKYSHPAMCKMDQEHDDNGVFVFVKWLIIAAGAVVVYVLLTSAATVHIAF